MRQGGALRQRPLRLWTALLGSLMLVLGLTSTQAYGRSDNGKSPIAAAQVLNWTAGNSTTEYLTFPTTAVAGPATIVFTNNTSTGNTTSMPHTVTFDTSNPEYNNDVTLNLMASPEDAQGGVQTAEVVLTPGTYRYFCTIPGHGMMTGTFTVTEGAAARTPPRPRRPPRSTATRTATARTSARPR